MNMQVQNDQKVKNNIKLANQTNKNGADHISLNANAQQPSALPFQKAISITGSLFNNKLIAANAVVNNQNQSDGANKKLKKQPASNPQHIEKPVKENSAAKKESIKNKGLEKSDSKPNKPSLKTTDDQIKNNDIDNTNSTSQPEGSTSQFESNATQLESNATQLEEAPKNSQKKPDASADKNPTKVTNPDNNMVSGNKKNHQNDIDSALIDAGPILEQPSSTITSPSSKSLNKTTAKEDANETAHQSDLTASTPSLRQLLIQEHKKNNVSNSTDNQTTSTDKSILRGTISPKVESSKTELSIFEKVSDSKEKATSTRSNTDTAIKNSTSISSNSTASLPKADKKLNSNSSRVINLQPNPDFSALIGNSSSSVNLKNNLEKNGSNICLEKNTEEQKTEFSFKDNLDENEKLLENTNQFSSIFPQVKLEVREDQQKNQHEFQPEMSSSEIFANLPFAHPLYKQGFNELFKNLVKNAGTINKNSVNQTFFLQLNNSVLDGTQIFFKQINGAPNITLIAPNLSVFAYLNANKFKLKAHLEEHLNISSSEINVEMSTSQIKDREDLYLGELDIINAVSSTSA